MLDGHRIVIPQSKHKEILALLHISHPSISKARKVVQQLYFWPGMSNAIKQAVGTCPECQTMLPSQQKEPLHETPITYLMEQVSIDLFKWGGHHYLVMVD